MIEEGNKYLYTCADQGEAHGLTEVVTVLNKWQGGCFECYEVEDDQGRTFMAFGYELTIPNQGPCSEYAPDVLAGDDVIAMRSTDPVVQGKHYRVAGMDRDGKITLQSQHPISREWEQLPGCYEPSCFRHAA